MSFILSWSGYFSRKGWDPRLWAKAKNANSYDRCAKLVGKMCVTPPTEEEYRTYFWDESFDEQEDKPAPVAISTKELKPEQPREAKVVPPKRKPRVKQTAAPAKKQEPTPPKKVATKTRSTRSRSKSPRTSKTKDAS